MRFPVLPAVARLFAPRVDWPVVLYNEEFAAWQKERRQRLISQLREAAL
jgi:hypothetical protein